MRFKYAVVLSLLALLIASAVSAAINTDRVTVATTATQILAAGPFRQDVTITNRGGGPAIFLGDSSVTTSTGFQLDDDQSISFTAISNTAIFGIVAAATEVAHVIRVN